MALQTLFSTTLIGFRPVIWYGQALYTRSSQLKAFLGQQLGEEYRYLLAEPHITDDALNGVAEAFWMSDVLTKKAVPITKLPENQQKEIANKLSDMLANIKQLSIKLKSSSSKDSVMWGEILEKITDVPGFEFIFCENDKIALVCWGFTNDKADKNKFQLTKEIVSVKETNLDSDIPKNLEPKNAITPQNNITPLPPDTQTPLKNKEENKKNKKWLTWIILGILLLLLIWIIWFWLGRKTEQKNEFLPDDRGKIIPIDTNQIVIDTTDGRNQKIVGNRLNIIIKKNNTVLNISSLAQKFKELYPSPEYQILYWDSVAIKQIQIQIPAPERINVKKRLKAEIQGILIIDESIFRQNYIPNDPAFQDAKKNWSYEVIRAFQAWDITKGKKEIVVAVIDNGFDMNHNEFKNKTLNPYNATENNDNVYAPNVPIGEHGTHVAGTVLGWADNSNGMSGIAPECQLMPVQVADSQGNMAVTVIINGFLYAVQHGAKVINMSLGQSPPPDFGSFPVQRQEQIISTLGNEEVEVWNELFSYANENNITVVIAAGNDNVTVGYDAMSRAEHCIVVSALDTKLSKAEFSNFGSKSSISAPGVQIYSSIPGNKYDFLQGTSMACPIVAGTVALMKSANPDLTNDEILKILQETGIPVQIQDNRLVGNLIQIDACLRRVLNTNTDCAKNTKKMDSLQRKIDSLKQICTNNNSQMIIPDDPKDFQFAMGRWRSSSDIMKTPENTKIALYFDFFQNGTGKLTFKEPDGTECFANLTLSLDKKKLNIDQTENAKCSNGNYYKMYVFKCESTNNDAAKCIAKNKNDNKNTFEFTLQKQ